MVIFIQLNLFCFIQNIFHFDQCFESLYHQFFSIFKHQKKFIIFVKKLKSFLIFVLIKKKIGLILSTIYMWSIFSSFLANLFKKKAMQLMDQAGAGVNIYFYVVVALCFFFPKFFNKKLFLKKYIKFIDKWA